MSVFRSRRAPPGRPWDGNRDTVLRRLIVQALGRDGWREGTLVQIARRLIDEIAPLEARNAVEAVRDAASGVEAQPVRLRLQLLGALAVPGWSGALLDGVARLLLDRASELLGEVEGLREALEENERSGVGA